MNYQNIDTTELLTYSELKANYPLSSIAVDGTENIIVIVDSGPPLIEDSWRMIQPTTRPSYNVYTEYVVEVDPINYIQQWEIRNLSVEEVNDNIIRAKNTKYDESQQYADSLVDEANATPYVGSKTTAKKNKRKLNARINHSSNGKPKKDIDKDRDDVLADYSDDVYDAQDSTDDVIEDMDDAEAIYALDIPTVVNWPSWSAPA